MKQAKKYSYILAALTIFQFTSLGWTQTPNRTTSAGAFQINIFPTIQNSYTDIGSDSILTPSATSKIIFELGCFGTNLRFVNNPISPNGTINTSRTYTSATGVPETITFSFPGFIVSPGYGFQAPIPIKVYDASFNEISDSNVVGYINGNTITISLERALKIDLEKTNPNDFGNIINLNQRLSLISSVKFHQTITGNAQQFMGINGELSQTGKDGEVPAAQRTVMSANGKEIRIKQSFPGQEGFCGGYHSPLMLFFKDEIPKFTKTVPFAVNGKNDALYKRGAHYFWPEKWNSGGLLVYDKNANGIIDDGHELFGDTNAPNGFQDLGDYDTNKDGIINKDDKVFSELKIWRDFNSDGVSTAKELKTLAQEGVESISLKVENVIKYYGERAQINGGSTFAFIDKAGKKSTGKVYDVYFSRIFNKTK